MIIRERTLIDWRQRLEDVLEEVERVIPDIEDMAAQAELESVCEKLRFCGGELEMFQEERTV